MYTNIAANLNACLLFQGLEPKDIEGVLHCLKPRIRQYKAEEYIALTDDAFHGMGILVQGKAVVLKENAAGDQVTMTHLVPGDFFGEMVAFSRHPKWPANVQAQSACTVLFAAPDRLAQSCSHACPWHTLLIENMLQILSEKGLMLQRRVQYLTMKSMRGKLSAYLLSQAKDHRTSTFTLPLNRNELAAFLNVSRPSMSRELGRMKEEGLLDYHRSAIRIHDLAALESYVE